MHARNAFTAAGQQFPITAGVCHANLAACTISPAIYINSRHKANTAWKHWVVAPPVNTGTSQPLLAVPGGSHRVGAARRSKLRHHRAGRGVEDEWTWMGASSGKVSLPHWHLSSHICQQVTAKRSALDHGGNGPGSSYRVAAQPSGESKDTNRT